MGEKNSPYVKDDVVESLWVRIKGMKSKGDDVVGVCYWLLSQDVGSGESFYRQLGEISGSVALVLMGFLWKISTSRHQLQISCSDKQPWKCSVGESL